MVCELMKVKEKEQTKKNYKTGSLRKSETDGKYKKEDPSPRLNEVLVPHKG